MTQKPAETYSTDGRAIRYATDGGEVVEAPDEPDEHPFDVATESVKQVNRMLAGTNGAICGMSFTGAVGYHVYVAEGETAPEYLWKIALLQALDTAVLDEMYVGAETVEWARRQVERELRESLDPFTAEFVADEFEDNLRGLIEQQESAQEGSA